MNPPIVTVPSVDVAPVLGNFFEKLVSLYPFLVFLVKQIIGFLVGLSIPLSVLFFIIIIYCVEQMKRIRKKENLMYETPVELPVAPDQAADAGLGKRWDSVVQHIESNNPNDWRQAIIDADIILDNLLTRMGYEGATIGEKLQHVSRGDFASLDDAWEAHKIRNKIAHEGSEHSLNHIEARRAIANYRRVFEEFYYI